MVYPPLWEIIQSLRLVDYLLVQADITLFVICKKLIFSLQGRMEVQGQAFFNNGKSYQASPSDNDTADISIAQGGSAHSGSK